MPEVKIEGESFLQVAIRFYEEKQVTFPIFGDFVISRIGIESCLESLQPRFTWELSSHQNSLLKMVRQYCTISKRGGNWNSYLPNATQLLQDNFPILLHNYLK